MAGLTVGDSGDDGMILILVASAEIGVVGGVAGSAGATLSAIDAFVWGLQWPSALRVDMTGAATVAALVVDGDDILGVVGDVALVVTGDALGAGGDLAQGHMVDIAMAALVVVVADDTGGIQGAGLAVGNGVVNRSLQGQVLGVGLGGSVIVMAEVAGVASHPAVQGVHVYLRDQGAIALLAKNRGIATVAVCAINACARGDRAKIVDCGGVVQG